MAGTETPQGIVAVVPFVELALPAQLGDAAFDQARAEGCALALEQAIEYALAE